MYSKLYKKILTLCLFFIPVIISAQDVSFSGYGAAGITIYDRNTLNGYNQEAYYEGQFQADIEYNKRISGQLDFRGNSIDNSVELREFSMKLELYDRFNLKIGNLKKPFGYEYLLNRDELFTINRSYVQDHIADLGYGGRSISVMGYYEYSKKHPEFPFSYYLSLFKNNSLFSGVVGRVQYHFDDDYSIDCDYLFQNKGGEQPINTQGFGAGFTIEKKSFDTNMEFFYVQDPFEGVRRQLIGEDDRVYSSGVKWFGAYTFDVGAELCKSIEPLLLIGYYRPDWDIPDNHVIQTVAGVNVYIHKKIRLRLNADLRMTKNQYNDGYDTKESRGIFEIQARF